MCKQNEYWDNGYLLGYYCSISGNRCDYPLCPAYEEEEVEE